MKAVIFMLLFLSASIITLISTDHLWGASVAYGVLIGVPAFHELWIEGQVRLERYHHKDETPLPQTAQLMVPGKWE